MHIAIPTLTLLLAAAAVAQDDVQKSPTAPTSAALTKALAKATVHNQRLLALLTDDGDDLAARLKKDRALSRPLLYEFEVVQLSGKEADTFAVHWKMPDALNSKPALAVLDADGKVLARLPREQLLTDGEVDGAALLGKLKPQFCPPVDADDKLAAGIAAAKKSGRAVFVRFDAPW